MLKQDYVDAEEDRLKAAANALPADERRAFYRDASRTLKDPDTYAALNWFFLTGLHHFYLGRWGKGLLDLGIFILGIALIIAGDFLAGILLILLVTAIEFWALFRSQIIVQDWNNRIYRQLLKRYRPDLE